MKDTPGMLVAEQNTRDGHSATIEISFSAQAYSIEHVKSSAGLRFDGYCIHQRYNRWIAALIESVDIYATASGSLR